MIGKILWLLATLLLANDQFAEAQQSAKLNRIGMLIAGSASSASGGGELLKPELRALGYVEGKNIAFDYRHAEGKPDRLPGLADDLVRLQPDVLVAAATTAALAAKNRTRTIPIVFLAAGDPVAAGLVDSLAGPEET
jgi:putative ABC transport system substrate-binding protein